MAKNVNCPAAWFGCWMVLSLMTGACSPELPVKASGAPTAAIAVPGDRASAPAPPPVVQQASAPAFPVSAILTPDRPLRHGDFLWNAVGIAPGKTSVVVDLTAQIVYVYRGGIEIGRSAILYGANDKPTPTGTFEILEKDIDHVSNLYDAPMPYMLRLTWDGIAIHGSEVQYGSGTHGCVGVPDEFAAMLFKEARIGDPVLVTHGWKTDLYGV